MHHQPSQEGTPRPHPATILRGRHASSATWRSRAMVRTTPWHSAFAGARLPSVKQLQEPTERTPKRPPPLRRLPERTADSESEKGATRPKGCSVSVIEQAASSQAPTVLTRQKSSPHHFLRRLLASALFSAKRPPPSAPLSAKRAPLSDPFTRADCTLGKARRERPARTVQRPPAAGQPRCAESQAQKAAPLPNAYRQDAECPGKREEGDQLKGCPASAAKQAASR